MAVVLDHPVVDDGPPVCHRTGAEGHATRVIPDDKEHGLLSFNNLVELHVLGGLRQRYPRIKRSDVHEAVRTVREKLGIDNPLANADFETDGVHLFIQRLDELENVSRSGQMAMKQILQSLLRRVDRDEEQLARRLFPTYGAIERGHERDRLVVIDPRRSFGRPIVARTGTPVHTLAGKYDAGEGVEEIAEAYRCTPAEVEEAIFFSTREAA